MGLAQPAASLQYVYVSWMIGILKSRSAATDSA